MVKRSKKKVLGRGLSVLLGDDEKNTFGKEVENKDQEIIGKIIQLDINKIEVNPLQPRSNFSETLIEELASSIKSLGLIQPITVRKIESNKFQLISGERRFRAAKLINLLKIPAYVRIANDEEILEMALVENIQRKDLDPIEIALCYERLIKEANITQDVLSERVGKKRSTIANYIRLLKLDPIIQTGIRDGFLSMGHGRAIINIEETDKQLEIYEKIISKKLSVRQTEKIVSRLKNKISYPSEINNETSVFSQELEKEFETLLDAITKVKMNENGKGSIKIFFNSKSELIAITKKIKHEK
ncbi:MAG: chromosome partitioning protein ParB [Flavobacteriaceae bacterium]|nr:chromosome partitioning protein ParB [Flavobacteriaceae bacterium]|tara:strand:- start:15924 stop:16826 length:903 start_codon:yes stop_codon:yes gene_type:complete